MVFTLLPSVKSGGVGLEIPAGIKPSAVAVTIGGVKSQPGVTLVVQ